MTESFGVEKAVMTKARVRKRKSIPGDYEGRFMGPMARANVKTAVNLGDAKMLARCGRYTQTFALRRKSPQKGKKKPAQGGLVG